MPVTDVMTPVGGVLEMIVSGYVVVGWESGITHVIFGHFSGGGGLSPVKMSDVLLF